MPGTLAVAWSNSTVSLTKGVDIITWNEDGQIVDCKVMIRPLKGADIVRHRMMKVLQRGQ